MKKGGHKAAVAAMDNITSISEFESEFHHAFIKSRLDHNDYVYKTALLRDLDEFCDVDSMHVPKGPLIVFGEPGSGKSAFLANWINRRKKKFQNWNNGFPEFIFYHAVGCTRQGAFVSKLLERILTEMNEYFELTKEVPTFEERLSWQFPRYLEAASRKGRTILIVDGVHRLRTSDGDSILKWLPLSFPPNVRLVLAATSVCAASHRADAADVDMSTMERIKVEAVRRNWTTVYINPFTDDEKQLAVQKFLSRQTGQATLQLFELQQKANNPSVGRTSNPMFLKSMLVALEWVAKRGYNIHSVLHEWLGVATMSELFEVILRSMEAGHTPTTAATSDAMLFLQEHSLDATFAWVPQSTKPPQSGSQQGLAAFASARSKQQVNSPGQTAQPSHRLSETSVAEFVKSTRRPSTVGGVAAPDDAYDSDDGMGSPRYQDETNTDVHLAYCELFDTEISNSGASGGVGGFGGDELIASDAPRQVRTSVLAPMADKSSDPADEVQGGNGATDSHDRRIDSGSNDEGADQNHHPSPSVQLPATTQTAVPRSPPPPFLRHLERVKTHRNIVFPVYVTGGLPVDGLGGLLGKALCVLYVARHGLLLHELRTLVQAMAAHEARIAPLDAPEVQTPADDDDGTNLAAILNDYKPARPKVPALPDTTWSTLLSALKALGCLFLQDIVLLPLCYDTLRDLIWWRYIGSTRMEESYHHWLVRFFVGHPPSFRRVEELPWHLASCKRWHALKDVLVNLPMFQLFFTATYKTELFCYWKTLTEGEVVNGSSTPPPLNQPPDELDTTKMPAITTFDLVREYNKSIEDWYRSTRPTTKQLLPLLQTMTKFVYEYSVFSQSELPVFNHPHFNAKQLHVDGFRFVHQLPHAVAQQALDLSLHWLYQRWVWVQFPWLALGHDIDDGDAKPGAAGGLTASISPENSKDDGSGVPDSPDSHAMPASSSASSITATNATTTATLASSPSLVLSSATANAATLSPSQSMPTLPKQRKAQAALISPYKLKGHANASLPTIATANAPNTLDIIGPNSPAHTLMRRKMQFIGFKNAPTSSFPAQLKHDSNSLTDPTLQSGVGKMLSQRSAGTAMSIRDSLNDSVCCEGFGLPAHLQEYAKTEADVKKSCNQQVLFKLQQVHNFLKRDANAKCNRLDKLRQKIRDRKARQASSLQYIQEAEDALHEMIKRMDQVDATLKVVAKQENTYSKLLSACDDFPASDKHHLAHVKKELKVLTLKLRDLQKENEALTFEQHHLATVEYPQLAAAVDDNKRLHDAVLERLNSTKARMSQDVANIEALYHVRKGIIDRVRTTAFDLNTNDTIELDKILHVQAAAETNAANKSQVAKAALEQCQSMCRRIVHATGLSNMAAIHEKFHNRDALNRSLDEQAALYEARLKQIKLSHAELEMQMKGLETTPKDATDPRQLEDLARDAEASLSRVQRAYATQLHALNEVMVGVSNIARLVGITDVRKPKRALIPAAELWPPYQDKESRAVTLAQFETLSAASMADLIRVCEERMVAIIDNNEHGRGDPDALFALSRQISRRESSAGLSNASPRGNTAKRRAKQSKRRSNDTTMSPRWDKDLSDVAAAAVLDDKSLLFSLPSTPLQQSIQPCGVNSSLMGRDVGGDMGVLVDDPAEPPVATRDVIKSASKTKLALKRKELLGRTSALPLPATNSILTSHHDIANLEA
ncbi:hypothetical protein H310_04304 [Aphanomyces invadans]|uniref:NACHT domain-containing protein n=1 Tax=Aphanomyces invadans TaxID=157072 RepID=A0A024UIH7_9STRA|nr:hypothetical protein H310_04304 [Aphanomyces invadans]ETW05388.1 hypothetical protein H310_04304 [Aphanomyces invadans]|eukprot:XP_008866826.1 hypothetical protein H310_04304 [Aphanomyces invadans]